MQTKEFVGCMISVIFQVKKNDALIWEQTNLKILKANFSSAARVCLKSTTDWGVKLTFDTVNLVDCYFKGLKCAL